MWALVNQVRSEISKKNGERQEEEYEYMDTEGHAHEEEEIP